MLPIEFGNAEDLQNEDCSYFDMHSHTRYSEDCGTRISQIVSKVQRQNIGIAITDHNVAQGSIDANKLGATVVPGIEITTKESKDVLVYFYEEGELKEFFLKHVKPGLSPFRKVAFNKLPISAEELLDITSDYNVVTSVAHPFIMRPKTSAPFFKKIPHVLKKIDAIEVINGGIARPGNLKALAWAEELEKPITGGSDAHKLHDIGRMLTYAKCDFSVDGILDAIKKNQTGCCGLEMPLTSRAIGGLFMLKNKLLPKALITKD